MTLFTEGRLQAFERMMQDTGKYHRREDSEDRPRKCPKKKRSLRKRMVSTMPVFRVEKNSNYTTMCNYHLRDQGLSLKGKGLLSMLLSLPDTWNYSVRGLSSITPDGVDGVLTALKELERLGYLERNQQRESNGRMGRAEYVIYEMPRKKPCSESPYTEKLYTVNPAQLSTNRTSTETINKREKKEIQHRYGSYENVLLSDTEYGKLRQEFPEDYQMRVERLAEYMASTGRSYKNHLATIRSWAKREKPKYNPADYTFEEGDSL